MHMLTHVNTRTQEHQARHPFLDPHLRGGVGACSSHPRPAKEGAGGSAGPDPLGGSPGPTAVRGRLSGGLRPEARRTSTTSLTPLMPRARPGACAWKLVFTSQPGCPGTGHSSISTFENKTLAHLPREETEAQRCKTLTQGQRPQSGQGQSKDATLVTTGSLASPRVGRVPHAPAAQVGERSTKVLAVRGQPGTTRP